MFISFGLKLFESCLPKATFYVTLTSLTAPFSNIFDLCFQIWNKKKSDTMQQQQSCRGFLRDSNPIFHEYNISMVVWLYKTHLLLHIDYVASYIIFKSSSLDKDLVVNTHLLRCWLPLHISPEHAQISQV